MFLVLFFVVSLPGSVGGGLVDGVWTVDMQSRAPAPDLGPSAECSGHARQPQLSQHSTTSQQLLTTNFQLYKEPFRGWVNRFLPYLHMKLSLEKPIFIRLQLKC